MRAGYLLGKHLGSHAEAAFLRSLTSPEIKLEPVLCIDLARMAALIERYTDLDLGVTDASVIAVAERLGLGTVAALDRRHFKVMRPSHVEHLELVP
jgi:uncharacterized protein